jgi:hypothetical protein
MLKDPKKGPFLTKTEKVLVVFKANLRYHIIYITTKHTY